MRRPLRQVLTRALPRGWRDVFLQLMLFVGTYFLYEIVRAIVDSRDIARATWNATRVIDFERHLHVFVEPTVQAWALNREWVVDTADWTYLNAHTTITIGALTYIYLRRNESFYFVRNMFMIAMAIALVGYAVYPTAPPWLMPQWGFTDSIQQFTGISLEHGPSTALLNLYAAIPSMHVCFAIMIGWPMAKLVRSRAARIAWRLYPVLVMFVVVATGNHYLTDVALGALTAAASGLLAKRLLARARPETWSFGNARAEQAAA